MTKKSGSASSNKWSDKVTRESNAMSLEKGVFTWKDPKMIAQSLKDSAEASTRRKAEPFRSAMSMLVFYINRAGKTWIGNNSAFWTRPSRRCGTCMGKADATATTQKPLVLSSLLLQKLVKSAAVWASLVT
jgi:hypothetical protein